MTSSEELAFRKLELELWRLEGAMTSLVRLAGQGKLNANLSVGHYLKRKIRKPSKRNKARFEAIPVNYHEQL